MSNLCKSVARGRKTKTVFLYGSVKSHNVISRCPAHRIYFVYLVVLGLGVLFSFFVGTFKTVWGHDQVLGVTTGDLNTKILLLYTPSHKHIFI